ncbi:hypothetical protein ACFVXG_00440 [Kitasatospora sp. NPDC058162]|uniref:hypothetical protein n=1 Tax=Kitasatospora sp. NPDC058162 TaxID=3346362 RepID=UPI0036DADC0D
MPAGGIVLTPAPSATARAVRAPADTAAEPVAEVRALDAAVGTGRDRQRVLITSALDADTVDGIMDLLRDLRDSRGLAVVLVSHDLPLVSAHADTVLTLGPSDAASFTHHRPAPSRVAN